MSDRFEQLYAEKFAEHGASYASLLWGDDGRQRRCYARVLRDIDPIGKTVVDVGCGFADLLRYLQSVGRVPRRYIGIDRNREFVEEARRRYPERGSVVDVRFLLGDALTAPIPKGDLVLAIGLLATTEGNWFPLVESLWDAASEAVVLTALSKKNYRGRLIAHSPAVLLHVGFEFSHDVVLHHDSRDQEIILTMRRGGPTSPPRRSGIIDPTSPQRFQEP